MDLTGMIQNPVEDQNSEQKLSKEEYAALKKQEREETWMQIDGQAPCVGTRWTGTVGVQGWSVLAEVSGFYGRAV